MMRDDQLDQMRELRAARFDTWYDVAGDRALACPCRRLAHAVDALRIEITIGRHEGSMLEIVDAECDRLLVTDRAEMSGHPHAEMVRFINRGLEFVRRDVRVGFHRGKSVRMPKADSLARVVGVSQR